MRDPPFGFGFAKAGIAWRTSAEREASSAILTGLCKAIQAISLI